MMLKNISRNLLLGALVLCVGAQPLHAAGGEAEYHSVVKLVESYYHVKHKGVPMLANLGMKAAKVVSSDVRRALRFGDFKLAYFEDQDFTTRDGFSEFHRLLREILIPGWDSLLAVRQRDEGLTYTFVKPDGDKYKVLIVVLAQREGTVLQVNLDRDEFAKLLQDPEQETRSITDEAAKTANDQ
jgi:hypothetical protein